MIVSMDDDFLADTFAMNSVTFPAQEFGKVGATFFPDVKNIFSPLAPSKLRVPLPHIQPASSSISYFYLEYDLLSWLFEKFVSAKAAGKEASSEARAIP